MSEFSNQINMNTLQLNSQLMQGTFSAISQISGNMNNTSSILSSINEKQNKVVYAKESDSKYKEEMDTDDDGVITFAEYIKYVTNSISEKSSNTVNSSAKTLFEKVWDSDTSTNKIRITDFAKVLQSYTLSSTLLQQSKISAKA